MTRRQGPGPMQSETNKTAGGRLAKEREEWAMRPERDEGDGPIEPVQQQDANDLQEVVVFKYPGGDYFALTKSSFPSMDFQTPNCKVRVYRTRDLIKFTSLEALMKSAMSGEIKFG